MMQLFLFFSLVLSLAQFGMGIHDVFIEREVTLCNNCQGEWKFTVPSIFSGDDVFFFKIRDSPGDNQFYIDFSKENWFVNDYMFSHTSYDSEHEWVWTSPSRDFPTGATLGAGNTYRIRVMCQHSWEKCTLRMTARVVTCSRCPTGQRTANVCKYSSSLQSDRTCTSCKSMGYYCDGSTEEVTCSAGNYCVNGVSEPCRRGSYCPTGSSVEQDCEPGYYCPTPSEKFECPVGSYCPRRVTSAIMCGAGYACNEVKITDRTPYECDGTKGIICPDGVNQIKCTDGKRPNRSLRPDACIDCVAYQQDCASLECKTVWGNQAPNLSEWVWAGDSCTVGSPIPASVLDKCNLFYSELWSHVEKCGCQQKWNATLGKCESGFPTAIESAGLDVRPFEQDGLLHDFVNLAPACADALLFGGEHAKASWLLVTANRCLFSHNAPAVAFGFRDHFWTHVQRIVDTGDRHSEETLALAGLRAPESRAETSTAGLLVQAARFGHRLRESRARTCQDICPCGSFSLHGDNGWCERSVSNVNAVEALTLNRFLATTCEVQNATEGKTLYIPGTLVATALYCSRPIALASLTDRTYSADVATVEKNMAVQVLDETARATELAIFTLNRAVEKRPSEPRPFMGLLDKVLRNYRDMIERDGRTPEDQGRGFSGAQAARMPLFTADMLLTGSASTGKQGVRELATKLKNVAQRLKAMEDKGFEMKAEADASAGLASLFSDLSLVTMNGFIQESESAELAVQSEVDRTLGKMGDITASLLASFTQGEVSFRGIVSAVDTLSEDYGQAVTLAYQVEEVKQRIAERDLIVGAVFMGFATAGAGFASGFTKLGSLSKDIGSLFATSHQTLLSPALARMAANRASYAKGRGAPSRLEGLIDEMQGVVTNVNVRLNQALEGFAKNLRNETTLSEADKAAWAEWQSNNTATIYSLGLDPVTLGITSNPRDEEWLKRPITPPLSPAVWSKFHKELVFLLGYEYKLCPTPTVSSAFDSAASRRLGALENRRAGLGSTHSEVRDVHRSLTSKNEELSIKSKELKEKMSAINKNCVYVDRVLGDWAAHMTAFQNDVNAIVDALRQVSSLLERRSLQKLNQQNWLTATKDALRKAAKYDETLALSLKRREMFTEAHRKAMGMEVLQLETMAVASLQELCEAFRYANPAPESLGNIRQGSILVNLTDCSVTRAFSSESWRPDLYRLAEDLTTALDTLADKWHTEYLTKYVAENPRAVSTTSCSIVDTAFFDQLVGGDATDRAKVARFTVGIDAFSNFCRVNVELVRMFVLFFDEDGKPLPSPGSKFQPALRLRSVSPFSKFTRNATYNAEDPTYLSVNPRHDFVTMRNFKFNVQYRVPESIQSCTNIKDGVTFDDGRHPTCSIFSPVDDSDTFLRATPYATWEMRIDAPVDFVGVIGRPTRAEVQFEVISEAMDGQSYCDPRFNYLPSKDPITASLGATCQFRFEKGVDLRALEEAGSEVQPSGGGDNTALIAGIAGGVACLVSLTVALAFLRHRASKPHAPSDAIDKLAVAPNPLYGSPDADT